MKNERLFGLLLALLCAAALSGCGDTWSGLKKDTGENLEAVGEAVEKAGEKVKNR